MQFYMTRTLCDDRKNRNYEPKFEEFIAKSLILYIAEYKKIKEEHGPAVAARSIHAEIDSLINKFKHESKEIFNKVPCKKKCHHCCKQIVFITADEIDLIVRGTNASKIKWDKNLIEYQKNALTPEEWDTLENEKRKCVFLGKDGTCKIYDVRPSVCRLYFVLSDPEHCDTIQHPKDKIARLTAWRAEILASTLLNTSESGAIPSMLLKYGKELF